MLWGTENFCLAKMESSPNYIHQYFTLTKTIFYHKLLYIKRLIIYIAQFKCINPKVKYAYLSLINLT